MGINPVSGNHVQTTQGLNTNTHNEKNSNFSNLVKDKFEYAVPAGEEVSISAEGFKKSNEEPPQTHADSTVKNSGIKDDADIYPLEYYSLPHWMTDVFTIHLPEKLTILGPDEFKPNYRREKIDQLTSSDRNYYLQAFTNHLAAFLEENGLKGDIEKYYQTLIANKELSEQYRPKWEARIATDTRYMEILEKGRNML